MYLFVYQATGIIVCVSYRNIMEMVAVHWIAFRTRDWVYLLVHWRWTMDKSVLGCALGSLGLKSHLWTMDKSKLGCALGGVQGCARGCAGLKSHLVIAPSVCSHSIKEPWALQTVIQDKIIAFLNLDNEQELHILLRQRVENPKNFIKKEAKVF